jgi:hypothetical protein
MLSRINSPKQKQKKIGCHFLEILSEMSLFWISFGLVKKKCIKGAKLFLFLKGGIFSRYFTSQGDQDIGPQSWSKSDKKCQEGNFQVLRLK